MSEPLLRLDHINTFYGAVQAHFDLSLEVGRGRIVCLLGGNASGKSTTMKVILGLVAPRSGAVTLDGKPIKDSTKVLVQIGTICRPTTSPTRRSAPASRALPRSPRAIIRRRSSMRARSPR